MEQPSNQPIHWDQHRGSINVTLILSVAVVALGLYNYTQTGEFLLIIVGLAVALFTWLTNPRQYWIYSDALVIVYGRPRIRTIPFTNVSHVDLLSLPIGDRLRVRLVNGRTVMLQARDAETFQNKLEGALNSYRGPFGQDLLTDDIPADEERG